MLPLSSAQLLILAPTRRYAHISPGSVFKMAPDWTEGQITADEIRLKQVQGARFLPQNEENKQKLLERTPNAGFCCCINH